VSVNFQQRFVRCLETNLSVPTRTKSTDTSLSTLGCRLHLVWRSNKHNVSTERCLERVIPKMDKHKKFCIELKSGTLEGPCTCVCDGICPFLDEEKKVEMCSRKTPLSELRVKIDYLPCGLKDHYIWSWSRFEQRHEFRNRCRCCPVSSYPIKWI